MFGLLRVACLHIVLERRVRVEEKRRMLLAGNGGVGREQSGGRGGVGRFY